MFLQYLALAWLFGSVLAALGLPWLLSPVTALLATLGAGSMRWSLRVCLALLLAITAVSGALSYLHSQPAAGENDIGRFALTGPVRVLGVVEGDRDERQRSLVLHLRVSGVDDRTGVYPASGLLLVRMPSSASYIDGDRLELRGNVVVLNQLPDFDRTYLAKQGVSAEIDFPATRMLSASTGFSLQHVVYVIRARLDKAIRSVLPEPEATLGAGLAL